MNRTEVALVKSCDAVRFAKDNNDSNTFFRWCDTYNRFSFAIQSVGFTRQNRKLLPFNRAVFAMNNGISVCTLAREENLEIFVLIFKFYKPYFIHKPIFGALLF